MVNWDSAADSRLFLAVLKVHDIKLDYEKVAAHFGEGATKRAIVERIAKLKKTAAASSGGGSVEGGVPVTPKKTPRKNQKVLNGGIGKMTPTKRKIPVKSEFDDYTSSD